MVISTAKFNDDISLREDPGPFMEHHGDLGLRSRFIKSYNELTNYR